MTNELQNFDPNGVGIAGEHFFSLPTTAETSSIVLISVPWDVTVSYGKGCSEAPHELLLASSQIDLYDAFTQDAWRKGIATLPIDNDIKEQSDRARLIAEHVIEHLEAGGNITDVQNDIDKVNEASKSLDEKVYQITQQWIKRGKIVGLVGGDHSTPYGYIKALGEKHKDFGILHIDAHRDLRCAHEGFISSHASIMYNILKTVPQIGKLVQVGVRDFCDDEQNLANEDPRVISFDDRKLYQAAFLGTTWDTQCDEIIAQLPQKNYISFDIDGLDIAYTPHTGTPVPGGLSYNQAIYLLEKIIKSGKEIIGFDLVEVAPSKHSIVDLSVGVRILFKLSSLSIMSKK